MSPYELARSKPISELALGLRVRNVLVKLKVVTQGDLTRLSADDLTATRCLGELALAEIREQLAVHGLTLRGEAIEGGPGQAIGSEVFERFRSFAGDPGKHLGMPVWVLDLCPMTRGWLVRHRFATVRGLLDSTEDDLWLLGLDDDLPLEEALGHLEEIRVRLGAFGLRLREARPAHRGFRLPIVRREDLAAWRLDEFRLRAQTIFRLQSAGIRTLGDLASRSADLGATTLTWPTEPRSEVRDLLDLLADVPAA